MGILFAVFGVIIVVPVVMFLTMCMANIVFVDSLIAGITSGVMAAMLVHLHPAICILIGIAAFCAVIYAFLHVRVFYILAAASTFFWAYIAGFMVHDITHGDLIWAGFTFIITAVIIWMLHMHTRNMIGMS